MRWYGRNLSALAPAALHPSSEKAVLGSRVQVEALSPPSATVIGSERSMSPKQSQ